MAAEYASYSNQCLNAIEAYHPNETASKAGYDIPDAIVGLMDKNLQEFQKIYADLRAVGLGAETWDNYFPKSV